MDTAYEDSSLTDASKKELTVQALQVFIMANTETFSTIVHRSGRIGCRLCRGLHFDRKYDYIPDPALEVSLQGHTTDVHPSVGDWGSLGYLWGHRTILDDGSKFVEPMNTYQNTGSMNSQERLLAPPYEDHDMTPPLSTTQHGFPPMTVDPSALLTLPTSIPATNGLNIPQLQPLRIHILQHWLGQAALIYQTKLGAFERKTKEGMYGPFLQQLMQQAFDGHAADDTGPLKSREDQMLDMIDYLLYLRKLVLEEPGDPLMLMINE
ncbi:hypothetical protein LTR24_003388 [Lithohypha guttulata]|uniref:Uncharacterized protein n=1 Tax=Lithohypha guttulata TaxID=1690604 RepID=A0ABR0KET9_9EURO|nr:hypothetical protein LTR24_003388 [Lithohypha guttulata]